MYHILVESRIMFTVFQMHIHRVGLRIKGRKEIAGKPKYFKIEPSRQRQQFLCGTSSKVLLHLSTSVISMCGTVDAGCGVAPTFSNHVFLTNIVPHLPISSTCLTSAMYIRDALVVALISIMYAVQPAVVKQDPVTIQRTSQNIQTPAGRTSPSECIHPLMRIHGYISEYQVPIALTIRSNRDYGRDEFGTPKRFN